MRRRQEEFLPSVARDLEDGSSVITPQNVKILGMIVGVIVLYLCFRVLFSSGAGIASFKPEYCYEIMGYSSETYFLQARCWADLVKEQTANSNTQVRFTYWAPSQRKEFETRLKELKRQYPEMKRHWGSPIIFEGCENEEKLYIGGFNNFLSSIQQRFQVTAPNNECASFI